MYEPVEQQQQARDAKKNVLKKILIIAIPIAIVLILLVLFAGIFIFRDVALVSKQAQFTGINIGNFTFSTGYVSRFSQIIQIPSVIQNTTAFPDIYKWILFHYPKFVRLYSQAIETHTYLFVWKGKKSDKPMMFLNHYDVVPAGDLSLWTYPPFDGTVANEYVYGRGSLDTKSTLAGVLEAAETLLNERFVPEQDIYFVFQHDEETGGVGAPGVAKWLKNKGIKIDWILDEGTPYDMISKEQLGIPERPNNKDGIAFIGLIDRGVFNVQLSAFGSGGGHASVPPKQTAIGIIASAITNIEKNPIRASFQAPVTTMLEYLVPEMALTKRFQYNNLLLFENRIFEEWSEYPHLNSQIRPTIASTIIQGGVANNVLPQVCTANLNVRIRLGETCDSIRTHLERVINDNRVNITMLRCQETEQMAKVDASGFNKLASAIKSVNPNSLIAPALFVATTDAVKFRKQNVVENTYLFSPYRLEPGVWLHSVDEKIALKTYEKMIQFYYALLKQL